VTQSDPRSWVTFMKEKSWVAFANVWGPQRGSLAWVTLWVTLGKYSVGHYVFYKDDILFQGRRGPLSQKTCFRRGPGSQRPAFAEPENSAKRAPLSQNPAFAEPRFRRAAFAEPTFAEPTLAPVTRQSIRLLEFRVD
jgi:hypothetical protein